MKTYRGMDWYVISHTHNNTGYYLARFLRDRIQVVCNEYYFVKYCLENKGISLNISFGKALREIYKIITGNSFGERSDEDIGIELYAHVYYYLMALGLEVDYKNAVKKTSGVDGIVILNKGLGYINEKISEQKWIDLITTTNEKYFAEGIRRTKLSTEVADLDLFGGNSRDVVNQFKRGSIERVANSTEQYFKETVISRVGKSYSIKEDEIDFIRDNKGNIKRYNLKWTK
ncbi:hypothetical protein [Sebaldella sp. S0638]|uniref:hypothetical protein n=1 Tax=Sebaldella sp. S0638 TaxID=2957809 RepID=UPI00209E50FB|nr:hypothetical protein [Sebaldella sp. S0638]MCP1225616.1 hypothetical protein [Sebaldella sp. S0638]